MLVGPYSGAVVEGRHTHLRAPNANDRVVFYAAAIGAVALVGVALFIVWWTRKSRRTQEDNGASVAPSEISGATT